jgi:hypothetical protein
MHLKLSVIKIDLIQKDGNLSQESIPSLSSFICYTFSSSHFQCSNRSIHWNSVLKATLNAFCLADVRKMALQCITTADRRNNVSCVTVPTILWINCRGLSVKTSNTILEVISDVSWNHLLLMQINKINFCQFLKAVYSIRIC